ncbi:ribonuclease P protein component [Methylocella sp.]|uniref:ribonuclease P protein component n=1 Tax=Methylocella sp. TaxID=1978226 RepID=UPI0037843E99
MTLIPPARAPARLKKRADFLRAAKGGRRHAKAFTLQAADRAALAGANPAGAKSEMGAEEAGAKGESAPEPPRFGFTVTKKTGGAVERNRIRRRLKEALRLAAPLPARAGRDYVVIARIEALTQPFLDLQADLIRAVAGVEGSAKPRATRPRGGK